MHLVKSVIFSPSCAAYLSPTALSLLMRTYFSTCLALYIARGRPALPIAESYANVSATPTAPSAQEAIVTSATKGALDPTNASPNPWLPILQSTILHHDGHLPKLQRALAHFAARPPAASRLTMHRVGWMREGQEDAGWDRHGLFSA
ncbi:hypothetical protein BV20DRAFT_1038333 [Pilatotrama ljubarskyi]|nr:hypothetical protein BV20DRAFT_1038333 [Pilatotrama ljubarskyi]